MTGHSITLHRRPADEAHGYPYQARCTCGWKSPGYVAEHAARQRGQAHVADPWEWCGRCYAWHPEGRHCVVGID